MNKIDDIRKVAIQHHAETSDVRRELARLEGTDVPPVRGSAGVRARAAARAYLAGTATENPPGGVQEGLAEHGWGVDTLEAPRRGETPATAADEDE